jgi:hypothetical protein
MTIEQLQERCFWQKRAVDEDSCGEKCLRSYTLRDKCGAQWGYGWIYEDGDMYRVVRYCYKGRTTFNKYKTAYQALKSLKKSKFEK